MRRSAVLCMLAGLAVLAPGCASDNEKPGPMEPTAELAPGGEQSNLTLRCRNNGLIVVQLAGILSPRPPARLLQTAIQKFALVEFALLTRKKPLAQTRALDLIDFLADNRGNLIDANSPSTLTKLGNVTDAILCIVGLQPTGVALGPNTGIGVVPANNPDPVIITTPQGDAGIRVPPRSAPSQDVNGNPIPGVVVTVTGLGTGSPLNTLLDKYGQTVDLTASQEVLWLAGGVTVAICVTADDALFDRLRLGHEGGVLPKFGAIEILPQAATGDVIATVGSCGAGLGARSAFEGLRDLARRVLLPQPLYATAVAEKVGGVGGTTRKFSKFGAVDPLLALVAQPTSTDGTAGAPVAQPPSVLVRTLTLNTPIPGIQVQFAVPASSPGTIVPGSVTTNSNGVAATTSWTLGLGQNTVNATGVSPVSEITFTPASVTFTAEGTGHPIEYRSGGYRFLSIGSTPPSPTTATYPAGQWFLPQFAPTAWGTGGAPFGESGSGCSVFNTSAVVTAWEASEQEGTQADPTTGSGLLVRRGFTTPVGFTGDVLINVAIDNDIQVYVDGTDVTSREGVDFEARTNSDAVNGSWDEFIFPFQPHLGCANQNDGTFTVPSSLLAGGTSHVIAVYAHDWGGASYLDIEVALNSGE